MQDTLYTSKIQVTGPPDFPSTLKCFITLQESTLHIRLSSLSHFFSLYICQISQSDFAITKREQGIKVDFQTFTRTIVSFFHRLCENMTCNVTYEKGDHIIKLAFVENDSFRNITRLELLFYKPDENEFRKYLAESIKRYENDNVRLIKENVSVKERMAESERRCKEKVESVEKEIREMQMRCEKMFRENCVNEENAERLVGEKRELEKKIVELEKRFADVELENEKLRINGMKEEKNKRIVEELNLKLERMEVLVDEKEEKIFDLEDKIKEMKNELKEKERKYEDIKNDIKKTKKEREEKNKKYKENEDKIKKIEFDYEEQKIKIKMIEKENIELKKKLENAQSVYNHFYTKKIEKNSPHKSEDTSLFSSIEPESPPH